VALVSLTNSSDLTDLCAEHDNITVYHRGDVRYATVIATHPTFTNATEICPTNWDNCPSGVPDTNYFDYLYAKPYDDGTNYLIIHRLTNFWRPYGMVVMTNGTFCETNIHYIELGRNIPGTTNWPTFLAMYSEGYTRLVPFPTLSNTNLCMGSSVIIGPAEIAERPYADIESVDVRMGSQTLFITYRNGEGTALADLNTLSRSNATVKLTMDFPGGKPFLTLRSMHVTDTNCDVSHVEWVDHYGTVHIDPIKSFQGGVGREWFYRRVIASTHNESAPDIRIVLQ
jgi:hypothetical protein